MALFKPYKITSDKLEDLSVQEGQIIITTDTKKLYVDVSATERIEVTSEIDLSNYVTVSDLTSTVGEEASERQKQDNLLKDKINTKLDTTQADDKYALKDYPKLTGNVEITSNGWAGSKIIGAHSNGDVPNYYQYAIGFDLLHRPYIAKRENDDNVSMIYLDTDKIIFDQPLAFTDSSGVSDYNSEASMKTRENIGAAAINHTHDVATTATNGFMSAEDKEKLDGLENVDTSDFLTKTEADGDYAAINHSHDDRYYTELEIDSKLSGKADTTHTHTIVNVTDLQETIDGLEEDIAGKANVSHTHDDRYFTETEVTEKLSDKANLGHKHDAGDIESGTILSDRLPSITDNKIVSLSASKLTGTIPSANLPSYVDDVVEGETTADFPGIGETGKIYVATSTNKTYRWGGSGYVEISASLALGTTSSTAFRGDYGNVAYTHAIAKGSAFASGLYKITTNAQGHVTAATTVTKNDITALGIPAQDTNTNTTYELTKSGSTITLEGSDGSSTSVTDSDTTYSNMTGATSSAAGKAGLVPAPAAGTATRYLRSDGTWQVPPNTTYTLSSFGITATAAELNKLDGCTATVTELNYVDGVTSNIQTQLNGKAASSHTHSYLPLSGGTLTGTLNSRAIVPTATNTYSLGTSSLKYSAAYATTFYGSLSGNASSATKLGSSTVGSGVKPIYLNAGTATASSSTVGSATRPVYLNGGTITQGTYTLGAACAKGVDTSISTGSTSTNLPTSKAVADLVASSGGQEIAIQSTQPTDSNIKLWIKI